MPAPTQHPLKTPETRARTRLDTLILCAGFCYLTANVYFRYVAWGGAEGLDRALTDPASDFGVLFAHRASAARFVLFFIGTATAVLTAIGLIREGTVGARRGMLRAGALLALIVSALASGHAAEFLEKDIVRVAATNDPASVLPLVATWHRWQRMFLVMAGLVAAMVALADRASPPLPRDGAPPGLTRRQYTLLLLLGTATLFEGYDRFILSLALPYIARDLGAAEGSLGWALATIRAGALFAIVIGRFADRFGRRPLLLITILGYTIATAATGLSRGVMDLILFQIIAMGFLSAELSLAQVVIAEEYPPHARAAGQGHLGAAAALGAGAAALLFPWLVTTGYGWRGLYFIGILPLLLVTFLRRALPETGRWQRAARTRVPRVRMVDLLKGRFRCPFVVLVLVTASATAAAGSAFAFHSFRATEILQWPPARISVMVLIGGGLGFWGWMVFGWLADTAGRRPVGVVCLVGGALAIITFYCSSHLMLAFTLMVFFESGVSIAINALTTELFPTTLRATAKSWVTNAAVVGAMLGLALVGALAERAGGHNLVIAGIAVLPAALAPLLFLLPETHRRELEQTSAEIP